MSLSSSLTGCVVGQTNFFAFERRSERFMRPVRWHVRVATRLGILMRLAVGDPQVEARVVRLVELT